MRKSFLRTTALAIVALAPALAWSAPVEPAAAPQGTIGPDVTVYRLPNVTNHGSSGGIRGYSVATTSCNIGDQPLSWCDSNGGCGIGANGLPTTAKDHPVIGQNMYRLSNGRFDQIGASWLKHGFLSLNQTAADCGPGTCASTPLGGRQLGVGCTDPYSAPRNGSRPLGPKSEVNATTGDFPFPHTNVGFSASWNQRIAVAETDLTAAQNPGARYFVEGQYIAPDDAVNGNGLNNASYAEVTVNQSSFSLSIVGGSGGTVREKAAIQAWKDIDPDVELFELDVRENGLVERFHVARKVTQPSPGVWHYEYAVHNLNSDRSADQLTINFFSNPSISAEGFHDVNAHSGQDDLYDTTDWPAAITANSIDWSAPAPQPPATEANAIRWATMYNFWFDSNYAPTEISSHVLGLHKPGTQDDVVFWTGTGVLFADSMEDN